MEKSFVSKAFSPKKLSDAELSTKANAVLIGMTNNKNFPDLQSKLVKLKTDADNYGDSLSKAIDGSRIDTLQKNINRSILESTLKELAAYVQLDSKNDAAIILSSGFDLNKKPTPVGMLDKPVNFTAKTNDLKGSIILSCEVIAHTKMYLFEYTISPVTENNAWTQVNSTRHKILIQGLQHGQQYAFRVAALGTHPTIIRSNEITCYVI